MDGKILKELISIREVNKSDISIFIKWLNKDYIKK